MGEADGLHPMFKWLMNPVRRRCPMCGVEFNILNDADYYCSMKCRNERYSKGLPQKPGEEDHGTQQPPGNPQEP